MRSSPSSTAAHFALLSVFFLFALFQCLELLQFRAMFPASKQFSVSKQFAKQNLSKAPNKRGGTNNDKTIK